MYDISDAIYLCRPITKCIFGHAQNEDFEI